MVTKLNIILFRYVLFQKRLSVNLWETASRGGSAFRETCIKGFCRQEGSASRRVYIWGVYIGRGGGVCLQEDMHWGVCIHEESVFRMGGLPNTSLLTASGGHCSGRHASYWKHSCLN